MAFTSITTVSGVTTIKVTSVNDVSGITLERSGNGYIVKYADTILNKPTTDSTIAGSTTKVKVVVGVGNLESLEKEFSLGLNVGQIQLDPTTVNTATVKTVWGSLLKDQFHYAWINGTPGDDTYDFTDVNSPNSVTEATRKLMTDNKRGIWVDLANGDDTIVGSPFGDSFSITGTGVKKIDGGANEGTTPQGNVARDSVDVYIKLDPSFYNSTAVIEAMVATISVVAADATDPKATGYTHVLMLDKTVLAYLKNVEQVNIQIWRDFNKDSRVQWDADPAKNESTWAKNIQLAVNVGEIRLKKDADGKDTNQTDWGILLKDAWHYAWINGTLGADTIKADDLVSDRTKKLMLDNSRGLWIDAGAGNDTITGSPYSDNILGGDGNDKVDGGTQIAPATDKGRDVFEIRLTAADQTTAQALLSKIKVVPSDDTNYTWMVQRLNDTGAVVETDYLINIEAVNISINQPGTNKWLAGRWQTIALDVNEIRVKKDADGKDTDLTDRGTKLTDQMHYAWVNGNSPTESFDYTGATTGAATVSAATKALMVKYERGLWVNMGGGNDKIVGSPYGDNFNIFAANFKISGLGTRFIDGGENKGKTPWGNNATDNIDVFVEDKAQAAKISVSTLSETPTKGSEEETAKKDGYTGKILSDGKVLAYIKGIEFINIQVWNDVNGDGQLQWDQDATKNEITWVSNIRLSIDVSEIRVKKDTEQTEWNTPLADSYHMAWIKGTEGADSIAVKTLVSQATQAIQLKYSRGVNIESGSGNDTIVGSDYSDNILGGAGDDLVDGGSQIAPTGQRGQDVFEVRLQAANATDANAMLSRIRVVPTTENEKAGYQWKVEQRDANGNVIEVDYLTNIEAVNINISTPSNQWLAGRWQTIALNVGEMKLDKTDPTKTVWNSFVKDQMHFAWVNGTSSDESFDYTGTTLLGAETISADTKKLMVDYQRGLSVDLGGGNDQIVGSPYGDNFEISGSGIRFIDGGTQLGTRPNGGNASDNLNVYVNTKELAASVTVMPVDSKAALGTKEAFAFASKYTSKIMSGTTVLAYIKEIEWVNVQIWNDINTDGQRQWDSNAAKNEVTFYGNFRLAVDVNQMRPKKDAQGNDTDQTEWGTKIADQFHFAWINGTESDETIDAKTLVSTSLLALQATHKRGLFVNGNAGKDTITGSDYSDNIQGGAGDDLIDGGTQIARENQRGQDVFEVRLTATDVNQANSLLSRVSVLPSDKDGYQWMVVQKNADGSVSETDHLKNIESVNISVNNAQNQWLAGKWINTAVTVGEIRLNPLDNTKVDNGTKLTDQFHFAWVNGTSLGGEKFDYTGTTTGAETVTKATKDLMVTYKRGLSVDLLGGSDTVVGSPYGDNFNIVASDSGIEYLDGGDNLGTSPSGQNAKDYLDIFVANEAEGKTISVVKLPATSTNSTESDAIGKLYTHKVLKGTATIAFIKNIERVSIQQWTDTNSDGQRQWGSEVKYLSGSDLAPSIGYNITGDATKNTVWVNGTNSSDTINVPALLATLPTSTDPKLNWAGTKLEISVNALNSFNATIIGSPNSENFDIGMGVSYVDGGGNTYNRTWANNTSTNPADTVRGFVMSEGAARNITVVALKDIVTKTPTDLGAINDGYLYKASANDGTNDIVYIKNVEQFSIRIWNDLNKNGMIDWGNEVTNFNFINMQTPLVSWTIGEKGAPGTPPTNVFISGSRFTPTINAKELIDSFVAERKAYPVSPTDLPSTFTLADIANSSASYGAFIMAGSGDHVISGTDYTDFVLIDSNGSNLINGGADVGYWKYNGNANNAMDRVRITEEVLFEGIPLSQSFLKVAPGETKAFALNNTPNESSDDATANYSLKSTDSVFMYLLPLAGKIGFNGDIEAIKKALVAAKTVAEFSTALTNAKAIADVNFGVFLGLADINGDGKNEFGSIAFLNEPATITNTTTEVTFTGNSSAVNKFTVGNLLSSARFNSGKHHLINLADNKLWDWTSTTGGVSTAPQSDMTAITTFAAAKNVLTTDYEFALVTYSEFDATKVVGVQLLKDIESLEFRLWLDLNKDNRQSGVEYSNSFLSYSILKDSAIYATEDLGSATVGGKQYAGISTGTSKNEIIDLKTSLQPQIRVAEQTKKLGINSYDYSGNDTITGTDFDDLFWLGNGVDTYDGGNGSDRMAFYWVPKENATLYYSAKSSNVVSVYQKTAANVVTELVEITFDVSSNGTRLSSGSIKQLNEVFADAAGASTAFAVGTPDKFSSIEELIIVLDSSIKNTDGSLKYTTGGVTDVNPFVLKMTPAAEYFTGTGADATKNTITFTGSPFADNLDAAAMLATLPTSSTAAKDNWRGSTLHTNIFLNGGGDTVKGTANSDLIDPGTGVNYIDGGANVGRTAWVPSWIETKYTYWGAESPSDQVRFLIKDPKEASGLVITRLDQNSTGGDATAFTGGYTVKAVFTAPDASVSTNYLKNVEYVGLRLWTDANKNNLREGNEVTSYSFTNIDKPAVNWRFLDLNDPDFGPFYFNLGGGSFVNVINAQSSIDEFVANKKLYPVTSVDKVTSDLPSNFTLSSVVNYANARGAYVMAGTGEHYVTGTNFNDTIVVSNTGNNWIDGGTDEGYAKYDTSSGAGTIRIARDTYRVAQSVVESGVSLTNNVSASNFKVVRLSDSYEMLNSVAASPELMALIDNAKTSLMTKYSIASGSTPEFAVVKYDPAKPATVIGIDLLRNIELFDIRNWFDADNNGRPSGTEIGTTSPASYLLKTDSTLFETADQSYQVIAGKSYAGLATGTSFGETSNMQTELEALKTKYSNLSNNSKGMMIADQGGNDTYTGTNFDDIFMLSSGNDTLTGGDGTQDRVAVYWKPSTAGTSIQVVKSTTDKTIKVTQTIGSTTTDLLKFTLINTGTDATSPYWKAEHTNTTFALGWSDSNFGTDKLYGIEQAVVTLHADLIKLDGTPTISLTGLTNNSLLIDLTLS